MEPFIGTILAFGFNFPPRGWAFCNGALLPIRQYTALFSLLGTAYGGDGRVTFGIPDLRGRTAIGSGNNIDMGESGGAASHTVSALQMPAHIHAATSTIAVPVLADGGNQPTPAGNSLAQSSGINMFSTSAPDSSLAPFKATGNLSPVGGGQPVSTISPYLTLNYSIAVVGIFPSRN